MFIGGNRRFLWISKFFYFIEYFWNNDIFVMTVECVQMFFNPLWCYTVLCCRITIRWWRPTSRRWGRCLRSRPTWRTDPRPIHPASKALIWFKSFRSLSAVRSLIHVASSQLKTMRADKISESKSKYLNFNHCLQKFDYPAPCHDCFYNYICVNFLIF